MFQPMASYRSAPYQQSYYEPRSYPAVTETRSYDPTQLPQNSYPEPSSMPTSSAYGAYTKEPEAAKAQPGQFSYSRGFAQPLYTGFYSDSSYGILSSLTSIFKVSRQDRRLEKIQTLE